MLNKILWVLILVYSNAVYASSIIRLGDVDYASLDPEVLALISKANNNETASKLELADRLFDGKGLKKDILEAIKWYTELAIAENGYAAFMLSIIYQYGIGVATNLELSHDYYKKGFKYKDLASNLYAVAMHLKKPDSTAYSIDRAIEWFNKAIGNNHWNAMNDLAEIYLYNGDPLKALNYYGRAASHGSNYAKYAIGTIYYDGKGIEQNKKEAFKWFLRSATGGFAPAQYRVAQMYTAGDGVARDPVEAYAWFDVAKKSMVFNKSSADIASNFSQEDLKEALELAKEYNRKFTA